MTSLEEINKQILELQQKKLDMLSNKDLISNEELIDHYILTLNSQTTQYSYNYALKKFLHFVKGKNLQKITALDLENYYNYLNDQDLCKKTKVLRYTVIVNFYKKMYYLQEIGKKVEEKSLRFIENPIKNINRKWKSEKKQKEFEYLTNAEIKQVLKVLEKGSIRKFTMFYILADTSMRVNGLLNIKVDGVNLEKRIIQTFDKGKWRKYAFGESLKNVLVKYLEIRPLINSKYKDSEYLFFSYKGFKVSPSHFHDKVFPKKLIKKLTGKDITPHCLRRSFKSNRQALGQPWNDVEKLMDHQVYLDKSYDCRELVKMFDAHEEL